MEKPTTQAVLYQMASIWSMHVERKDTLKFPSATVPHLTPEGLSHFKQHVISHANVLYCIAKLLY